LTQANIQLLDAGDRSEVETTRLNPADSRFHLFFVPEGDYILHIEDAADVTYEDLPNPPGTFPLSHEVGHTLRTYGTLDQPLAVHDDIPSLTVSVPDKASGQSTSRAAAVQ
jgi:hypothetical protein